MSRRTLRSKSATSQDLQDLSSELRHAGDRDVISGLNARIRSVLRDQGVSPDLVSMVDAERALKKNYSQKLSEAIAQKVADGLRSEFPGIRPDAQGIGQETRAQAAGGMKKLDVSYMTPQYGLGLAVSIKTINFCDPQSRRYTKNVKRVDGELRVEADDVHRRQPFAVLAGLVLLPEEAANDSGNGASSAHHAHAVFQRRVGRPDHTGDPTRFEQLYIGLYSTGAESFGRAKWFDVRSPFPNRGLPDDEVRFSTVLAAITETFRLRNKA